MSIKTPVLDNRTSEDIYRQTMELTKMYCPELMIPEDTHYFNPDNPALVMYKVFSKMTEFLITQLNQIPDKHRLAFLDFVGIDLLPARPAKVPLTFYLAEGSSGSTVPINTQVASADDPEIVFETTQDLSVIPIKLDAVFSLNPWEDKYSDHTDFVPGKDDGFTIFGKDAREKYLDHVLFIGDDTKLDIGRPAKLVIHISGKNLTKGFFSHWYIGKDNLIENPDIKVKDFNVTLDIDKLEKTTIDGEESFWLSVRPEDNKAIIKGVKLPEIENITFDTTVDDVIPDSVFFNNTPVDAKKGFYPFGEQPRKGDTFYLGSEEVFSKTDASITLKVELEGIISKIDAQLNWEYWDGKGWKPFTSVSDKTNSFAKTGEIVLVNKCPSIKPVEINGQLNRWVRVRIGSGGYGTAGTIEHTDVRDVITGLTKVPTEKNKTEITEELEKKGFIFGFKHIMPSYQPPFIKSLGISYSYTGQKPGKFKTYNYFEYKDFNPTGNPFDFPEEIPALYLGFKNKIGNTPVTLFVAVKEKLYDEKPEVIKNPEFPEKIDETFVDGEISLVWKYFNGKWEELSVEDETDSFRIGGIVRFHVPSDIETSSRFGQELNWIRVEIKEGKKFSCPKLNSISPNTVWALNNLTLLDEVLGSGNGEPGLSLFFSKKPVLEGQILEVKESDIPSKDELTAIEVEEGTDALHIIEKPGKEKEVWVRWHETKDFALSGHLSRHYVLERANGKITFGDGIRGMVPPRGMNNIIARKYKSGGGKKGDLPEDKITLLKKTIPNIDKVTNHISSTGGMDQEDFNKAINRGPHTLKNRNRAVTKEDFEWLAQEASQYVAKAKCIVGKGAIQVIIVPKYESDAPLPEAGLLDLVEDYLKNRALLTILDRIEVVGPLYKKIDVDIKIKPVSLAESGIVLDRIEERLKKYLHPLKGGENGEGWDFGQDIFISKMASVIEALEGVDYVQEIKLKKIEKDKIEEASGVKQIIIESNALPSAGTINVEIEG